MIATQSHQSQLDACIKACLDCLRECENCATACLDRKLRSRLKSSVSAANWVEALD